MTRRQSLRWVLAGFFLALAVPATILVKQAYSQLQWQAFHQRRVQATELAERIDARFSALIAGEAERAFSDYQFLVVAGDASANFVQRSPLSGYPVHPAIAGLVGYFQVDDKGQFSTPILPGPDIRAAEYGVPERELKERKALARQLRTILQQNRLAATPVATGKTSAANPPEESPAESALPRLASVAKEAAEQTPGAFVASRKNAALAGRKDSLISPATEMFKRLAEGEVPAEPLPERDLADRLGRVEDLKLEQRFESKLKQDHAKQAPPALKRLRRQSAPRKERSLLPKDLPASLALAQPAVDKDARISVFESEVDPFEFSRLESGHFVLFRRAWHDGKRYIQGAIIQREPFLQQVIRPLYQRTALSAVSKLLVAFRGDVLAAFNATDAGDQVAAGTRFAGELLYQARLTAPLQDLQLIFSITRLPVGPAARVIDWAAATLLLVLLSGFGLMYRLATGQIALARQQQDFVSAVSHELKTPITAIRMYGEMLREGWADEDKKKTYYDFIFHESERLSRLVGNVLQLSRMTRNEVGPKLEPVPLAELMAGLRATAAAQTQPAGFELSVRTDAGMEESLVEVDRDFFTQIIINLIDNAIKFSARAQRKRIEVHCQSQGGAEIQIAVRDYGPGISRAQMKKIFRLFYRAEDELTRETVGTGIGLALVERLTRAMGGRVDVANAEPGAVFTVVLSLAVA